MDQTKRGRPRHPDHVTPFRTIAPRDVRGGVQFPPTGIDGDGFWEDIEQILARHMAHDRVAAMVTELFYDLENYSLGDLSRPRWYIHHVSNWGACFHLRADERLRRKEATPDDRSVFGEFARLNGLYAEKRNRFGVHYDGQLRNIWRRLLKERAP